MGRDDIPEDVVRAAVRGDRRALTRLLESHHERLLRYVEARMPADVRGAFDPYDVLQDTYVQAARQIGHFKSNGPDAVHRWLVTIARHAMLDLIRYVRAGVRNGGGVNVADHSSILSALDQISAHRRSPSQSAAAREFMETIERSLERLPPDYRRVLTLRHIEGHSVAETAAMMSRAPGAIHMLCSRALQTLRGELKSASHYT